MAHYFASYNKQSSQYITKDGTSVPFRAGFAKVERDDIAAEVAELINTLGASAPYYVPDAEEVSGIEMAVNYGTTVENGLILADLEKEILKKHGIIHQTGPMASGMATAASASAALDPAQAYNTSANVNDLVTKAKKG